MIPLAGVPMAAAQAASASADAAAPAVAARAAAPVVIAAPITAVTVYADRAVVSREGRVSLPAGEHDVVFENLPAGLLDDALQASATGSVPATILDVSSRQAFRTSSSHERVRALDARIEALGREQRVLDDRAAVLDNQRTFVGLLQQGVAGPDNNGSRPSLEEMRAALALSEELLARGYAEQRTLDEERTALERQVQALEAERTQLQGRAGLRAKTVTVRMALAKPGQVDLHLAYTVRGASWKPAYDARLQSGDRSIALSYFGVVSQNTGEDWNNVQLTLSTARPSLGGSAPTVRPWVLDVRRAPPPMPPPAPAPMASVSSKRASAAEMAVGGAGGAAVDEPQVQAERQYADLQGGLTSASFRIATPATLPSGNATQKVAISALSLPATLRYQATPALVEAAFLNGEATNDSAYPLLRGTLNAFLDDTFIAASTLKTVMPGDTLELALGADEGISVQRKQTARQTENTGFSGSGRRVTQTYVITVQNHKKTPETLVLQDQLPVSRHENIVVKLLAPAEKEIKREDDGKIVWNWTLEPGEKREATFKFSVDYPGDMDVTGLE